MGCLYKIVCLPTDKAYFGITRHTAEQRWRRGHLRNIRKYRNRNRELCNAILQYGHHNFIVETIAECSDWQELQQMERAAIVCHKTWHPHGYNSTRGKRIR
jgi:hypothetical protein